MCEQLMGVETECEYGWPMDWGGRYMSPERLNGSVYTWAADVWSAGIIMLEVRTYTGAAVQRKPIHVPCPLGESRAALLWRCG
jgi:hypothetical protein